MYLYFCIFFSIPISCSCIKPWACCLHQRPCFHFHGGDVCTSAVTTSPGCVTVLWKCPMCPLCPSLRWTRLSTWESCIIHVRCYFCFMSFFTSAQCTRAPTSPIPCNPPHRCRHLPLWTCILWRALAVPLCSSRTNFFSASFYTFSPPNRAYSSQ